MRELRLCVAAVAAAALFPSASAAGSADQELALDILREQIAVNTVEPHGSTAAAKALASRFRAAGFHAGDVRLLAPHDKAAKGNLVVRLKGAGKAKPVLWICHLDVVEAKPEDWSLPPFELTEKDGYLYGRGAADVKGECALLAANLVRLKREGVVLDRDIILAFTADEETGDANGVEWLLKSHRSLVDAEFVMNPDGGGGSLRNGKPVFFAVQTSEKIYLTFQLETTNRGGHSSVPPKENAIVRLARGMDRLAGYAYPLQLTPTTRSYFREMAAFETGRKRADMLAVAADDPDADAAARLSEDPMTNAQLRTTCVFTGISGGHAENALPQRARAIYQCRMMPGDTQAAVQAQIVRVLADPQIAVSVLWPAKPSPESPPQSWIMKAVAEAVHAVHPATPVIPWMDLGASDGVHTRSAGLPTYAVGAIFGDMDDVRIHGRDERIGLEQFNQGLEINYRLMRATSEAAPG